MNIVGISAYYHDSACCLLQNGEVQAYECHALLRQLPEPVVHPARNAQAKFLAALYTIHWERRFDADSAMPRYWCDAAITAWGGIQETMLAYVTTRIAPPVVRGLSVAEQRFFGRDNTLEDGSPLLGGEGRRLLRFSLDPVAIELICKVLEDSGRPVRELINQRLVEQQVVNLTGL